MKCKLNRLLPVMIPVLCLTILGVAQAGPLKVGAARVDISADAYEDGNPPPRTYAHEWLYIRAIVLDNGETKALLLGADLSGIRPDEVYQDASAQISRELGIPVENMIMSGTHTHSGLRERRDPQKMQAAIVQAARAANANLQPGSVGFAEGMVYLNVNRDVIDAKTRRWTQDTNLDFPSDKTLAVLAFYDEQGAPIAGYMNYAMHPVNGYLSGFRSGDAPGAASRHVEQAFGDTMVMVFVQGASGDQNPLHLRNSTNVMAANSGVPRTGFEMTREVVETPLREGQVERRQNDPVADEALKRWMDAQGQVIGEEAIRVMSHMDRLRSDVRIAGRQTTLTCPGRDRTNADTARAGVAGSYADGEDAKMRLGVLGINEIALASINAEVYNIIGQQVKAASPLRKTMLVTVANGRATSGYIPSDDAYGRQTFQVVGSRLKPGCAQTGIVRNFTDMIYEQIL
ncbi:MAG: hypothetical protein OEM85_00195 [Gammaproteobacteria bacterium]|nr:hypothetical protein [Gammaproteobacteria bacterium]